MKIAKAYKSCAGEYPGLTHAHTDLHFNEFWHIILAKHSRPKGKYWSPFSELHEIVKITKACKSGVGVYPGLTHAHNPLATFAVSMWFDKIRTQAYPGPIRSAWAAIRVGACIV